MTGIFDDDYMPEPSPEEEGQEGGIEALEGEPPSEEQVEEPVEQVEEPKKEPELLLGKFKDTEALATGYVNLMNRLGQSYDLSQFESVEDLSEAYKAAERQLGGQSRQPSESEQLRQQIAYQNYQMQQMAAYMQAMQQQMQQQAQQQPQHHVQQPVDATAFLDQLYEKGPEAITPIVQQIVQAEMQRAGQDWGAQINNYLRPLYQRMQAEEVMASWNNQANKIMQEVEDFDEYREDMKALFENPNSQRELLSLMQSGPNGLYMALRTAYDRAKANRLSKDGQAFQSEMMKHAARLGGSSGRMTGVKQTPEDIIKQQIFGAPEKGGIFD